MQQINLFLVILFEYFYTVLPGLYSSFILLIIINIPNAQGKSKSYLMGTNPIFLLIYLAFLKIIHIPITINTIPAKSQKSINNKLLIRKNSEMAPNIPTGIKSPFSRVPKR